MRAGGEAPRECQRLFHQLLIGDDPIHDAELEAICRLDPVGREEELARLHLADQAWQEEAHAVVAGKPDVGEARGHERALSRQAQVARQCARAPGARGRAPARARARARAGDRARPRGDDRACVLA